MGAGLSGLSCAITLEQNGIYPTIFEKRSVVGDRFVNAEALLDILNRPVKDCISYFSEIYESIYTLQAILIKWLFIQKMKKR